MAAPLKKLSPPSSGSSDDDAEILPDVTVTASRIRSGDENSPTDADDPSKEIAKRHRAERQEAHMNQKTVLDQMHKRHEDETAEHFTKVIQRLQAGRKVDSGDSITVPAAVSPEQET